MPAGGGRAHDEPGPPPVGGAVIGRLVDVAKWLSAAADRRTGADPAGVSRLESTIAVIEQDYARAAPVDQDTDRLAAVAELYRLDDIDRDLLLLAAAADLDGNIALAYGLLRGGSVPTHPSIGLALELLGVPTLSGSGRARFAGGGRLVAQALLDVGGTGPWLSREIRCPDRVVTHLAGARHPDRILEPLVVDPVPLPLPGADELTRALEIGAAFVWIHSPPGTAGLPMVTGALTGLGVRSLCLTVPADAATGAEAFLRIAVREAALTSRCLVLDGAERLASAADPDAPHGPAGTRTMPLALVDPPVPVIAIGSTPWDRRWSTNAHPYLLAAPRLGPEECVQLWAAISGAAPPPGALAGLRLSPDLVDQLARTSSRLAATAGVAVTAELVRRVARQRTGSAAPDNEMGLADLVLPDGADRAVRRL